jgi:hypothetical protein
MRACLRTSAVSHVLSPCGGKLTWHEECVATNSEAAACGVKAQQVPHQAFIRAGAAAGKLTATNVEQRLSNHFDVLERAKRPWPEHLTFIAPSDVSEGVGSLALRYISDDGGRPRKRKGIDGAPSQQLQSDGANQPRYGVRDANPCLMRCREASAAFESCIR